MDTEVTPSLYIFPHKPPGLPIGQWKPSVCSVDNKRSPASSSTSVSHCEGTDQEPRSPGPAWADRSNGAQSKPGSLISRPTRRRATIGTIEACCCVDLHCCGLAAPGCVSATAGTPDAYYFGERTRSRGG